MLHRRAFLAASALPALGLPQPAAARFPVNPVTLVTHSSPGGGSDVFLRELVKHLTPIMQTSFAVENIRGGSGAAAVARVARSAPNGGMLYATTPTYIQTSLLSRPEVGWDGLDPMAIVFLDPQLIYTRAQSPHRTLREAMDAARANPGRQRWGAANPASLERIAMERLNRITQARAAIVSHDGGADLMIGVLNGTFDVGIGEIQELRAQLEPGRIRLLGVLTEARLPEFPEVPTAREQGIELVVTKFRGLAGPKGIPDDIAAQWEAGLRAALATPAYRAVAASEALVPLMLGRAEARAFTERAAAEIAQGLREMGVLRG
jgi:putative tricarboxylic transport membrane protein